MSAESFDTFAKARANRRLRCKVCELGRIRVAEMEDGMDSGHGAPAASAWLMSLGHKIGTATIYKHMLHRKQEEK